MKSKLNRMNDYLFKWIFGREEHKDILLDFLNSVLSPEGNDVLIDITLAERELDPEHIADKMSRLDILGKASDGSIINIEVQIGDERNIDKRTLYYWAKLYHDQLQEGQQYKDLSRTVTVNVLGFDFLPEAEKYHSMYGIYEKETRHRLNEDLEIHFLELTKWKTLDVKPKTRLDKWLMFLSNTNSEEMEAIAMDTPAIKKALTAEEIFLKQDKERYLYEMREKGLRDHLSAIDGAREQGIQQGIQQGQHEGKLAIASRLLLKGSKVEDVADITGLTVEEICKLKN